MVAAVRGVSPTSSTVSSLIGDLERSGKMIAYSGSGSHESSCENEHQHESQQDTLGDSSKRRRIQTTGFPKSGRRTPLPSAAAAAAGTSCSGVVVGGLHGPRSTTAAVATYSNVFGSAGFSQATTGATGIVSGVVGALTSGPFTGGLQTGRHPLAGRNNPASESGGFSGASQMKLGKKNVADGGNRSRSASGSGNRNGTGANLTNDHQRLPGSASTIAKTATGATPGTDIQNGTVYGEPISSNQAAGFANRSDDDMTGVPRSNGICMYSSHASLRSTSSTAGLVQEVDLLPRPHLTPSSQLLFTGLPISSEADRSQLQIKQAAAGGTYGREGSVSPGSDAASHAWPKWD